MLSSFENSMIVTEASNFGREQLVKFLGLTEREQEVAILVSSGFTNRQIAQKFFTSTRTVECHVTHINRKLGTCKRSQIAARVLDLALYFLNEF